MTVDACVIRKAKAGRISEKKADELLKALDAQKAAGGTVNEQAVAALSAVQRLHANRRRQKLLLAQRQTEIGVRIRDAAPDDKMAAALSWLHFDEKGRFGGDNVASMEEAVRGQIFAKMSGTIERFRSRAAGLRRAGQDQAGMRALLREMTGETSGDAVAKELSEGANEAFEYARRLFNEAGGDIGKIDDFGVPHVHNRQTIAAATKQDWIAFVRPKLDRGRMIDFETNRPISEAKLDELLDETYDKIVTDGMTDIVGAQRVSDLDVQTSGLRVRRAVGNRRQQSRFLVFRNADSWFEYQERFGSGNIYEAIMHHVDGMARDIALMKVLGPNPDATVEFMKRLVVGGRAAAAIEETGTRAVRLIGRDPTATIDALYAQVSGSALTPDSEAWAKGMGSVRAWLSAVNLGGAFLSAVSDVAFTGLTSSFNGFSGMKTVGRLVKTFGSVSKADRMDALNAGFAVDTWTTTLAAQQRFTAEAIGHDWARRVSDTVLRGSFLSAWTEAGKAAFQREFLGYMTRNRRKAFGDLPDALKRSFRRHGVTSAEWDLVRARPLVNDHGGEIMNLAVMASAGGDNFRAATRLQQMILNESKFAVPEATAKTRALLTQGLRPGSLPGEVLRSVTLFKTFPVTVLQTHLFGRLIGDAQMSIADRMGYAARLFIGTVTMGALAVQLKDIAKGRDPRPMGSAEFLGAALAQGGGLGIFGDFLFSDHNRFGGGLSATLAGPVAGLTDQALRLTAGNIQELITEGEAKGFGAELTRFVRALTPGQNLWYTRIAMERVVFDNLLRATDPDYHLRFRRHERNVERQYGSGFFVPPGQGPRRAPDIANAFQRADQ